MPRTTVSAELVTEGGFIGERQNGKFKACTNYSLEVVSAISSPLGTYAQLDGFLYRIKLIQGETRECFITNDDACTIRSFTNAACRTLKGVQCVKCSDLKWGRHIFQLCNSFRTSSCFKRMTLVSAIGRQPDSDVWVLGPETQINSKGELLDKDDLPFYWYDDYALKRDATNDQKLTPLPIALPLQEHGIRSVLKAAKECLPHNFQSFYQVLSGMCMAMHFEEIIELQAECPMVLAYSEITGTGKTTSLRAALSLCGAAVVHFRVGKSSPTSLVARAAITTIPIGVDDIASQSNLETLSVQFFNGAALSTMSAGTNSPRTSLLFTSNKAFAESSRNAARLIHIPFFKGAVELSQREKEDAFKKACRQASSSIGLLISVGNKIKSRRFQTHINEDLLPLVCTALPEADFRVQKSYALLLGIGEELCDIIALPEVITFAEVKQFFTEKWAPEVSVLIKPTHSSIQSVLDQMLYDIEDLDICEVLRFLRPQVPNKSNPAMLSVAIHIPLLKNHCAGLDEAKFKRDITDVGGNTKASFQFLRDGCSDKILKPSKNGKQRKCVTIPHNAIADDMIKKLVERVSEESQSSTTGYQTSTPILDEELRTEPLDHAYAYSPIIQDTPFTSSCDNDDHIKTNQSSVSSDSEPFFDTGMEKSTEKTISPTTSTGSVSEVLFGVSMDKERTISPIGSISSVSELLFDAVMKKERTISPIGSISSVSELLFDAIMEKERTISPIGSISSVSVPFLDISMGIESTISPISSITSVPGPLFDINMEKTMPTLEQVTPSPTVKILGTDTILNDQIADKVDLTTLVSLRLDSQAVIRPVPTMELSTGKQEQRHQSTVCIDKEASIDDCILRIKQKTQMLLVAKIGSYKIYDNSLLSLIDDNGWVPDEVITSFLLTAVRKSNKEKVYVMDVSAVNDICNGTYIYKKKVLNHVNFPQYTALVGAYCFQKNHWILVIVEPPIGRILYIDPAMSSPHRQLDKIKKQWNRYSSHQHNNGYWPENITWEVTSIPHSQQQDNCSCGVYVMKFAQQYLDDMPLLLEFSSVSSSRLEMARTILNNSDDISEYCRTCSSKARKKHVWIGCDSCTSWYHLDCVNKVSKNKLKAEEIESVNYVGPCCSKKADYVIEQK